MVHADEKELKRKTYGSLKELRAARRERRRQAVINPRKVLRTFAR